MRHEGSCSLTLLLFVLIAGLVKVSDQILHRSTGQPVDLSKVVPQQPVILIVHNQRDPLLFKGNGNDTHAGQRNDRRAFI